MMRGFALVLSFMLLALVAWPATATTHAQTDLPFRAAQCGGVEGPGWIQVAVTPSHLEGYKPGWRLLVDRVRYNRIRVDIRTADRRLALSAPDGNAGAASGLGGFDAFTVAAAGRNVRSICVSLESDDSLSLLRAVKAMTPERLAERREGWLATAALACGVLLCALAYNLFLLFWLKDRFQRWYVFWLASGIAYTLLWTGLGATLFPVLGGAGGIRLSLLVISVLIGSGTAFFFDFIEPHVAPMWLRRFGRANAAILPLLGVIAALEWIVPAQVGDRALNIAFLISTGSIALGVAYGLSRGSRAVWFYLVAWSPPMCVFALRVARNFGALPQADAIDKASFYAIAFEAIMLSLAIADRFRSLLRERDSAKVERETLRRVASTDPMTGLLNRAAFQLKMTALQNQAVPVELLLLDLDDLKQTNDIAGHDAGDALIVEMGRRLVEIAAGRALVARLGGDEFAVLMTEDGFDARDPLLEFIEQSPATPFVFGGRGLSASISGGLASWHPDDSEGDLYKKADLALYSAKASGRGCWRVFAPAMLDEQEARHTAVRNLRSALSRGELALHQQPIIDLRTGAAIYNEALLRWAHPDRGFVGPDIFADAWDDPATARSVQDFVINLALDQLQAARAVGNAPAAISVNFLAGQLQGPKAAEHILDLLAERDLPPSALVVEVTETVVLGRPGGPVVECLQTLRQSGVRVALDDFGTGFASLVHLRDLSADILKIDRSFVLGVPSNLESAKIVRAIIALAHSLGLLVVAEGVETEAQHAFLQDLGCDFAQGFLFGRPMPVTIEAAD